MRIRFKPFLVVLLLVAGIGTYAQSGPQPARIVRRDNLVVVRVSPKTAANEALYRAVQSDDVDAAKQAFAKGASADAVVEFHLRWSRVNKSAIALFAKSTAMFDVIVPHVAKPNARGMIQLTEGTLLTWAAFHNDVDAAKILVAKGADVDARDSTGTSVLGEFLVMNHCADAPGASVLSIPTGSYTGVSDFVTLLLDHKLDVNAASDEGWGETPLMEAAESSNLATVKLLVAHGADASIRIHVRDQQGKWPDDHGDVTALSIAQERGASDIADFLRPLTEENIYDAAETGDIARLGELLRTGGDIEAVGPRGLTPLQCAVRGSTRALKFLLDHGAKVDQSGGSGETPLAMAAEIGNAERVKILLDHGASVNPSGKVSTSPLVGAISSARLDLVKLMLARGADLTGANGTRALDKVVEICDNDSTGPGWRDVPPFTHLTDDQILKNAGEIFNLIVAKGAGLRDKNSRALSDASSSGQDLIVETLLDKGVDINQSDIIGAVGNLIFAFSMGNTEGQKNSRRVIDLLLKRHANVNVQDEFGDSALMISAEHDTVWLCKELVAAGASVDQRDVYGETALIRACGRDSLDAVKYLVERGADVNVADVDGLTPLMYAVDFQTNDTGTGVGPFYTWPGHVDLVRFLLAHGANPNAKAHDGTTAHDIAVRDHEPGVNAMLLASATNKGKY